MRKSRIVKIFWNIPAIAKHPTLAGPWLPLTCETGQSPGFRGNGWSPGRKIMSSPLVKPYNKRSD